MIFASIESGVNAKEPPFLTHHPLDRLIVTQIEI